MAAGERARQRAEREWLDLVAELMGRRLERLPVEALALQLARTFRGVGCAFSAGPAGAGGVAGQIYPRADGLGGHRAAIEAWGAQHARRRHPILAHYRLTGEVGPLQVADLADGPVGRPLMDAWYATAGRWGCAEQLALPLPRPAGGVRAFVVGRDRAFNPPELATARLLWRLLVGLDRLVEAGPEPGCPPQAAAELRLTPRELAVLELLADGLTAAAIGRRLAIRERTVHKHLERLYTKLGVRDRLSAVIRAQQAGLVAAAPSPAAGDLISVR